MDLSIIVPFTRRQSQLARHLDSLRRSLDDLGCSYEVLIVDAMRPGPPCAERRAVDRVIDSDARLRWVSCAAGAGLDQALRRGFMASTGERVMTLDEHFAFDLDSVPVIARVLCEPDAPEAVVARAPREARRPPRRLARAFEWLGQQALSLALRQSLERPVGGIHGYRREAVDLYSPRIRRGRMQLELLGHVVDGNSPLLEIECAASKPRTASVRLALREWSRYVGFLFRRRPALGLVFFGLIAFGASAVGLCIAGSSPFALATGDAQQSVSLVCALGALTGGMLALLGLLEDRLQKLRRLTSGRDAARPAASSFATSLPGVLSDQ
ncbi:MAG: glycosyltransferase [Planctomycetota bacterium]